MTQKKVKPEHKTLEQVLKELAEVKDENGRLKGLVRDIIEMLEKKI